MNTQKIAQTEHISIYKAKSHLINIKPFKMNLTQLTINYIIAVEW